MPAWTERRSEAALRAVVVVVVISPVVESLVVVLVQLVIVMFLTGVVLTVLVVRVTVMFPAVVLAAVVPVLRGEGDVEEAADVEFVCEEEVVVGHGAPDVVFAVLAADDVAVIV